MSIDRPHVRRPGGAVGAMVVPGQGMPGSPSSTWSVPLAAGSTALLAVAIPAGLVMLTPTPRSGVWWGALALAVVLGGRYAWLIGAGRQRLVEMSVWLFSYVFLGLAPLVQLRLGVAPETTERTLTRDVPETLLVVVVGSLLFMAGATLRSLVGGRGRVGSTEPTTGTVDVSGAGRYPVGLWLFALGSIAMTAYVLARLAPALFTNLQQFSARSAEVWPNATTSAIITGLGTMPLLLTAVALVVHRGRQRVSRTVAENALFLVVLVMLVTMVNPLNSPRYVFGTVYLAMAAALGLVADARRFRLTAISAVLGLLLVFPLADAFRTAAGGGDTASGVAVLAGGDFDSFAQINNTVLYVDSEGITEGRQALGVALFWVPRSAWADKPIDTGILLADFRDYSFTNLSAPLWAELYINGGWLLLAAGGAALGFWARGRDDKILAQLRRRTAPAALSCVLPFYLIIVLRGSLLQATSNLVLILVSAGILQLLTKNSRAASG